MIFYLDTSVLVAALTREASTDRVQTWLAAKSADELSISEWVMTEFSAALSIKCRRREIDLVLREKAVAELNVLSRTNFITLSISSDHFRTAARLADQPGAGLRSGDALHLAVCIGYGAALYTLDQGLHEAASAIGVTSISP